MYSGFHCKFFASQDGDQKNKSVLWSSRENVINTRCFPWNVFFLGHVLFPRNLEGVDVGLLQVQELIEQGHTLVPVLLADTLYAL